MATKEFYFLILIFVCTFICIVLAAGNKDEEFCKEMRRKYEIIPGESFGSLPHHLHNKYLSAECYRFFCKPNPMSGKGKFKREYLPGVLEEFDRLKLIPS